MHFFASKLAYINKKHYLCGEKWNYSHHKVIGLLHTLYGYGNTNSGHIFVGMIAISSPS